MLFKRYLCCIAAAALILSAASAVIASPKIQFDSESAHLGKVVSGAPIDAVFAFKNVGDAELKITAVKPACGCTKAEAKKTRLAPGESSTIEAVFDTTGYRGSIRKTITIMTNDPTRPKVVLSLKANVVALATLKPESLNFGSIKVNESRTHSLLVYPKAPKTFKITKIESQGPHVSASNFKRITTAPDDYWKVTVLVKAGNKPGRVTESLDILAGPGDNEKVSIMVYGNIVE